MTTLTIHLPALDCSVSLSAYVRAVRLAKANPEATFKHGLTTWWPTKGEEIVEQFRRGVHERVNQETAYTQRGRQTADG